MNKNLKDRADRLLQSVYLDGYEHGYKDALNSILNYEEQEHYKKLAGHWVLDESDNSLECDECGCRIYANDIMNGEPHYCPNCGVRMVESEDE